MVTWVKLASSLVGYLSDGFAVAAFIPQALSAAARREVDLTPPFLAIWVLGGAFNLAGNLVAATQVAQKILASWYMAVNIVLVWQLGMFGSDAKWSPIPWKGPRNQYIVNERRGWWAALWLSLEEFDSVAVFKLCAFIEVFMLAVWSFLTLISMHSDPDWDIAVPTEQDTKVLVLGWCGVMCFFGARAVQLVQGWWAYMRGVEPEPERVNIVFYLLYLENALQLISIMTLDPGNDAYYAYEAPWIFGAAAPMIMDIAVIGSKKYQIHKHRGDRQLEDEIKDEQDAEEVEDRIKNLIVITKQKWRLRTLLDVGDLPKVNAPRREMAAYRQRKEMIDMYKEELKFSPQIKREYAWAHPDVGVHGPQYGPVGQFLERVAAPYGTRVRTRGLLDSASGSVHSSRSAHSTAFSRSSSRAVRRSSHRKSLELDCDVPDSLGPNPANHQMSGQPSTNRHTHPTAAGAALDLPERRGAHPRGHSDGDESDAYDKPEASERLRAAHDGSHMLKGSPDEQVAAAREPSSSLPSSARRRVSSSSKHHKQRE